MAGSRQKKTRATSFEHIIPESYLRNFASKEGVLYVYEWNKEVRESVARRECAEHQFYEFDLAGRKSNNAYENWLSHIEAEGKRILPLVCDRKTLEVGDRGAWASYVGLLFARTRKVRSQVSAPMVRKMRELTSGTEYLRDLQFELLKSGELHHSDELRSYIDRFQTAMENSPSFYHVTGLPRHTRVLAEALLRMKWHTVSAPAERFFVTTDCPVVTVQRQKDGWTEGAGFARENVVVLLPVTPEKVFAASAYFTFKKEAEAVYVDQINRVMVRFAHRNVYAGQNSERIKRLVDAEINQVVFGKNAFLPNQG